MIENNKVIVARLTNLRKHINADRLQVATILGSQVIVGINAKEGDLGIFIPEGMQLSEDFANRNDLVRRKDESGNSVGGMFEENRRVKTLKLRGEKSEGFWCPLSFIEYTGVQLTEGMAFNELNGLQIADKYITPATQRSRSQGKNKKPVRENKMMPKHIETHQLLKNLNVVEPGDQVYFTLKMHGTSGRVSHALVERKLPWYERWLKKLGVAIRTMEWQYIHGSRNVTFGGHAVEGFHGTSFREKVLQRFVGLLHKGETVYFEIVGYESPEKPIMGVYDNSKMGKEFIKKYGKTTVFSYGCPPGNFEVYVYRITQSNEDGVIQELTWEQVKRRCDSLGIAHVPEVIIDMVNPSVHLSVASIDPKWEDSLIKTLEDWLSKPDPVDPNHIPEGICVRIERKDALVAVLKYKGFEFKLLEGIIKDNPDFVDEEEAA